MQTNSLRRYIVFSLASLFTVGVLTACGGGGSSSSGGSRIAAGQAALQGNVSSGVARYGDESSGGQILTRLLNVAISNAYASGVGGVTVELLNNGVVVDTQTTDSNGNFGFPALAPGNYTLRLSQGGQLLGETPPIRLDPNTRTRLNLGMNGGIYAVEVEAEHSGISGEVEDDNSSDNSSSDDVSDDSSSDDVSDDSSSDDVSDDSSSDDVSDDSSSDDVSDDSSSDDVSDDCSDDEGQSSKCS